MKNAALFLIPLLLPVSAFAFEKAELSDVEITKLEQGQPIISVWKDEDRKHTPSISRGGIDIMAPASLIWEIMLDCDRISEVSTDIRECKVLDAAEDGSWDVRKQKFAVSPYLPKVNSTFRTDYSGNDIEGRAMSIMKISGDLKVQEGRWDIIPLSPTDTRVIYQAAIEPKFPIPDRVIRKQVSIGIPEILENLRSLAENDHAMTVKNAAMPDDPAL